jgi:hypothetical protein
VEVVEDQLWISAQKVKVVKQATQANNYTATIIQR